MTKEAYFIQDEAVKGVMKIYDGQFLYKIHVQTKKVEQIELEYEKSRVDFDPEYHYVAALSALRALNKFNKWMKNEIDKQSRLN